MTDKIIDPYLRHEFDGDTISNVYNMDVINLSAGAPGPDILKHCGQMLRRATEHRLDEEDKEGKFYLFQYGITAGLWECREELAKFLTRRYGDPVMREELILTCGATHGLHLLLSSIISPNGIIFIEEVTYMIAINSFKQFPLMRIVAVPMKDDNTVDLDAFERIIKEEKKKNDYFLNEEKMFWAMFYTIPICHNPTGMTLSPESCKRLVDVARENSIVVVCDDVYNLLHYGRGFPPHRLFFYDDPKDPGYKGGNVVSNGTFSKILTPAIRFGWMECSPRIVNTLRETGLMKSGGAVNHYVSGIIASLLHLSMEDEHLDYLVKMYRDRMAALCETLDRYLPKCCSYQRPEGGYFVWLHLPKEIDANDFIRWCQENRKVTALPGFQFSHMGKSKNFLRLSIGFHQTETLKTAVKSLCEGLLYYIDNQS